MKVRKYCLFYGRVQGVGFRYMLYMQATRLKLTGWVRNQYDGSVEACLQGEDDLIEEAIRTMKQLDFISIVQIEMTNIEFLPTERSFEIKY